VATHAGGQSATAALYLSSLRAAEAPEHRLTLDVAAGDPEIYRAEVIYPPGFSFTGFHTLGDPGTVVGAYGLDFAFDGTPDVTVPLRSLDRGSAYADVFADGRFDAALEPVLRQIGGASFSLTLPFGGDATGATLEASRSVRVSLVLVAGLIANPSLGGRHVITGDLTTVDPDTGGPDDGRGDPPATQPVEFAVEIDGPTLTPFAWLRVSHFHLTVRAGASAGLDNAGAEAPALRMRARDGRFEVHGRLALGPSSDGIDLAREIVTVTLDRFRQSIEGRSFVRLGPFYRYRGRAPGITWMDLGPDGRFHIRADGVRWIGHGNEPQSPPRWRHGFGPPLGFALRIGNDLGETTVRDGRGRHGF
jgi:hypothetical protein